MHFKIRCYLLSPLLFFVICFVFLQCLSPSSALSKTNTPHILLINSYHEGYDWSDDETVGIRTALSKAFPKSSLFIEFLDTKNFPKQDHFPRFADLLETKYSGSHFDVIIVMDNAALEFITKYRKRLFDNTPVVFCGINDFKPSILSDLTNITGVAEVQDSIGTLNMALELHPRTNEVIVVHDYTVTGLAIRNELESNLGLTPNHVKISFLENMRLDQAIETLQKLPPDKLVLILSYAVEKGGRSFTQAEAARIISYSSPAPAYAIHAAQLGHGVTGGKLLSGKTQGQKAGDLAVRIIKGASANDLPVYTGYLSTNMFDYNAIKKFRIDINKLPKDSIIINKPSPNYAINKTAFWFIILFASATTIILIAFYKNIQQRKNFEKTLRLSESKFKQLFNSAGDAIYITSYEGDILEVNRSACDIMGYSYQEFLTIPFIRVIANDQLETLKQQIEKIKLYKKLVFESVHITRGNIIIPVEVSSTIIDYEGQPAFLNIVRDISDRKTAEEEIHLQARLLEQEISGHLQTEQLLRTERNELKIAADNLRVEKEQLAVTLRSIGDGVITTDTGGRVVLINQVAENLTGWSQDEAYGESLETVFNIINETSREPQSNPVNEALNTGKVVELANHTLLISRDGTERAIADSAAPILNGNDKIIGVVLVFRDVSEKKHIEEELFKARKLESIGVLAGGIAHDFNNFLTAILGNISLAKRLTSPKERIYEIMDNAEIASNRAKSLTQQLLTFSKGGTPIRKLSSIGKIITESASFVLRGSNVSYHLEINKNLHLANVDAGQMTQVFNNLIINADQSMQNGGQIKICASNEKGPISGDPYFSGKPTIKISISDQGCGISPANLDRIFDPYFTTKKQGSGLGLATVYSIIRNHNGEITATSKEGAGTTFTILLPAVFSGEEDAGYFGTDEAHQGKGRILIMDDEKIICEVLTNILEHFGYEVETCFDGQEASEIYGKAFRTGCPFDLVIMDLTIPGGIGGKEAISMLQKINPNVCTIVSSGYANDPILAHCHDYGFIATLSKPYNIGEIEDVLKKVFNRNIDNTDPIADALTISDSNGEAGTC